MGRQEMSRTGNLDVKLTNKKEVILVFFSEKKKKTILQRADS